MFTWFWCNTVGPGDALISVSVPTLTLLKRSSIGQMGLIHFKCQYKNVSVSESFMSFMWNANYIPWKAEIKLWEITTQIWLSWIPKLSELLMFLYYNIYYSHYRGSTTYSPDCALILDDSAKPWVTSSASVLNSLRLCLISYNVINVWLY